MSTRRDETSPAILGAIRVSPRIHNQVVRSDILHLGDVYSAWRIAEAQAGEALGSWRDCSRRRSPKPTTTRRPVAPISSPSTIPRLVNWWRNSRTSASKAAPSDRVALAS